MDRTKLGRFRETMLKLWLLSPERLWLRSIALEQRGHWRLAFVLKQVNTMLYRNSLAPGGLVSPDIRLGHYSMGIVIPRDVEIGSHVEIHHNVTLTVRSSRVPSKIVLEDYVKIGTNAVLIAPRGRDLRIGVGARIGAGAVITEDVPAGATVVPAAPRVILRKGGEAGAGSDGAQRDAAPDAQTPGGGRGG